ncbi:RNA polymerase sigma factor [Spirosoma utsteinense]|uniref:RNA polymerase sigma-70 region 2 domain-containing protein n=1 Tax=Spirosoma utsteinense TaxID=2585773 RepID=A0ABR6WF20_9BACT|nr:sigma factor [Spirosoma utsteinense]MBC3789206.1 hypothetical protein [Spirosoma utsteinense]MBC3795126.1 hypothetical protein [Spirosoma utsteinense]
MGHLRLAGIPVGPEGSEQFAEWDAGLLHYWIKLIDYCPVEKEYVTAFENDINKPLTPSEHVHLWDSFRNGDQSSFAALYDLFAADLYRYGYNLVRNKPLVEDCLHELYLHLHESRARLGATDNIRFYLYRALRRRLLDTVGRLNKLDSDDYLFDGAEFQIQPYEQTLVEEQLVEQQKLLVITR